MYFCLVCNWYGTIRARIDKGFKRMNPAFKQNVEYRKCCYSEKNVQNPPRIRIRWYLPVGTGPDVPFLKSSVWRILQENTHFIVNSTGTRYRIFLKYFSS
jgi:hypothetical protein